MGERVTGKGALAQLMSETHLPRDEIELLFCLLIILLAKTALVPGDGAFVNDTAPASPALGVRYGEDNQRLLGRLSMAAFLSALVAEQLTGRGPLSLLQISPGVLMDEASAAAAFVFILLGLGNDQGGSPSPAGGGIETFSDDQMFSWEQEDIAEGEGGED